MGWVKIYEINKNAKLSGEKLTLSFFGERRKKKLTLAACIMGICINSI